eukprot:14866734-Alexandrium_andersonii.AAC.1
MARWPWVGPASGNSVSHGRRYPPATDAEIGHSSTVLFQSPMAMTSQSARPCSQVRARRVSEWRATPSVAEK